MEYDYIKSRALNQRERHRLRLAVAVDRQVADPARNDLTGARGDSRRERLLGALERLVSNPAEPAESSVLDWALCYASPKAIAAIIDRLSGAQTQPGLLGDLQNMVPARLLLREYITPDYQRFQGTSDTPERALICVTGNAYRLNIPVHHFHLLAHAAFDVIIYLRDDRKQHFLRGIRGMGESLDELAETLKRKVPINGSTAIIATSSGAIAATRLAERLCSERVALFSPEFSFKGVAAIGDRLALTADQVAIFASKDNPLDVTFMNAWKETHLADSIRWIDADTHGTLAYLVHTKQNDALLSWLGGRKPGTGGS